MVRWMVRQMNKWIDRQNDGQIDRKVDGQIDRQSSGQIDGWNDYSNEYIDRYMPILVTSLSADLLLVGSEGVALESLFLPFLYFQEHI